MEKLYKKIFVAGANGMLGTTLQHITDTKDFLLVDKEISENVSWCDIRDLKYTSNLIKEYQPDIILNFAALVDLEYCEQDKDDCYSTNTIAAIHLFNLAKNLNIPYVFISTAGIFGNNKESYTEEDQPYPLSTYGKSKYFVEQLLLNQNYPKYWIFRAGWMMGGGPKKDKKFVNKIMKQIKLGAKELFVVDELEYYAPSNAKASTVEFNLDVARFGNYKSGYGLFRVDNQFGDFLFVDNKYLVEELADGTKKPMPLRPGSTAYAKEAFKRSQSNSLDGITGLPIPGFAQSNQSTISLAKGNSYGIYITPNTTINSPDQLTDLSQILFSIKNANLTQQLQHVSMGTGYFAFEDMGFAGDRDFNDMLFAITPKNQSIIG